MQIKKIVLLAIIAIASFTAVQAQKGLTRLGIQYNVGIPVGSFKNNLSQTSARGFQADVLYGINNKLSLGFGTGFQDFYQKNPRQLYKLSDGSDVSAVLSNSIQTIPLLLQAKYSFTPEATIRPYVGLGVGGNLIAYSQLLGEFGSRQTKFGFAARPEAGVYVPFSKRGEAGLTVGASYNVMPFTENGFTNLNNIGVHAGVSIPLRR